MKLIYLHQYFKFPHESGGTRSYDLAKSFVKHGYEVEIITSTSENKYKKYKGWFTVKEDGLTVHYIFVPYDNTLSYMQRIVAFFKFMFLSTKKLLKIKADVVLATSTPLTIAVPALVNKRFKKVPFIFEVRDVWPEAPIAIGAVRNKWMQKALYWFEKKVYSRADAIISLSTDMEKSIITRYPTLKNKNIAVIENISEVNRFQQKNNSEKSFLRENNIPQNCFYVLYAGTFGKVNGLDYAVFLAKQTLEIDPKIIYLLVGSGREKDEIIENAQTKGVLNTNLFVLNSVSKAELPQLYSEVDMGSSFVINIKELWANSANKFFDTLAAGKPILINHEGWQKEVITKDNVGYALPPILNKDAIVDFVNYTQNKDLQTIQQENALKKASNSYSLEVATQKYISVLEKIVS